MKLSGTHAAQSIPVSLVKSFPCTLMSEKEEESMDLFKEEQRDANNNSKDKYFEERHDHSKGKK